MPRGPEEHDALQMYNKHIVVINVVNEGSHHITAFSFLGTGLNTFYKLNPSLT